MDTRDLAVEVIKQARRLSLTAVVDDDYPEIKSQFDNAVMDYAKTLWNAPMHGGVFRMISEELDRARKKFPRWPVQSVHAAAIVCEESGELIRAALQHQDEGGPLSNCDKEAIQTAAMCVRFLERK